MSFKFFKENAQYFFRAWVDYLFRRRLPGLVLLHIAGVLLLALIASFALDLTIPTSSGPIKFAFTTNGTPNWLSIGAFLIVAALVIFGLIWTARDLREVGRKRVIVVELRGLRGVGGRPLAASVPQRLVGRREQVPIDVRQGQDGRISEPKAALRRVESLPHDLASREAGLDRSDITYVLGGLAPVPLTFLVGVLMDDEEEVLLMDWNRATQRWSELDAPDDHKRFSITGLDGVPASAAEVVLAVSVSYGPDFAGIAAKFRNLPVVNMTLEGAGPDAHWSEEKQVALAMQFFETAMAIGNKGVRTIHLILVAPSSAVLRFGRIYDKRNLPHLIVYQYERGQNPHYPWGVKMPVAGHAEAEIVT